jgi:hypothetical protein
MCSGSCGCAELKSGSVQVLASDLPCRLDVLVTCCGDVAKGTCSACRHAPDLLVCTFGEACVRLGSCNSSSKAAACYIVAVEQRFYKASLHWPMQGAYVSGAGVSA